MMDNKDDVLLWSTRTDVLMTVNRYDVLLMINRGDVLLRVNKNWFIFDGQQDLRYRSWITKITYF